MAQACAQETALHQAMQLRIAKQQAALARREKVWNIWRARLAIGSETICGAAIELRGVMVEIAVEPIWRQAGMPSTIWLKRERVYPTGALGADDREMRCEAA